MKSKQGEVRVIKEIGDQAFPLLVKTWENRSGVFTGKNTRLPQDGLYEFAQNHRVDNKQFLELLFWLSISTTYGQRSDDMYRKVVESLSQNPKLVDKVSARHIAELSKEELASFMSSIGIFQQNKLADRWLATAKYIVSLDCQDLIELFVHAGSVTEFLVQHRRAWRKDNQGMVGIGPKTMSLLVVFCQEAGLISQGLITDAFPVDLWIMRIAWQIGYIEGSGFVGEDMLESILRDALCRYCLETETSPLILNAAMWRLGASCCTKALKCPRAFCPLCDFCQGVAKPSHKQDGRGIDFSIGLVAHLLQKTLCLYREFPTSSDQNHSQR